MAYDLSALEDGLEQQGIKPCQETLRRFEQYMDLLLYWNERVNLTAITDPEEIIVRHFLDSLSLIQDGKIKDLGKVIDIGTGAGFPGVPIKIVRPDIELVLLDSTRKRTDFLKLLTEELELNNIEIIHSRAEFLGRDPEYREQFQIVLSRAVASLQVLTELTIPFLCPGGFFIAYKGPQAKEEVSMAKKAIETLGGAYPPDIKRVKVPFSQNEHNLIYIQKTSKTRDEFPRTPKKIKKSPI